MLSTDRLPKVILAPLDRLHWWLIGPLQSRPNIAHKKSMHHIRWSLGECAPRLVIFYYHRCLSHLVFNIGTFAVDMLG